MIMQKNYFVSITPEVSYILKLLCKDPRGVHIDKIKSTFNLSDVVEDDPTGEKKRENA
jgi:hypothetical protein